VLSQLPAFVGARAFPLRRYGRKQNGKCLVAAGRRRTTAAAIWIFAEMDGGRQSTTKVRMSFFYAKTNMKHFQRWMDRLRDNKMKSSKILQIYISNIYNSGQLLLCNEKKLILFLNSCFFFVLYTSQPSGHFTLHKVFSPVTCLGFRVCGNPGSSWQGHACVKLPEFVGRSVQNLVEIGTAVWAWKGYIGKNSHFYIYRWTSEPGPGAAREKLNAMKSPTWTFFVKQSFFYSCREYLPDKAHLVFI